MISTKDKLMLDNVCTLISIIQTEDEYGIPNQTKTEIQIFCAELAVTSSEFFKAQQNDIKDQKVLVINSEEYQDEKLLKYEDKYYSIYRKYPHTDGYIEIYCSERLGNGD